MNNPSFSHHDPVIPARQDIPEALDRKQPVVLKWLGMFSGLEWLILCASAVQILCGILLVTVSLLGLIRPVFLSGLCSFGGSVAILLGSFLLYSQLQRYRNPEQIVNEAVNRVLRDMN